MASDDDSASVSIDLDNASIDELFAWATAKHDAGRLDAALEGYARILEQDHRHAATLVYVADIYLKFNRAGDARLMLEHLQKLDKEALADTDGLSGTCLDFARIWGPEQRVLTDRLLAHVLQVWPEDVEVNEAIAARLAEDGDAKGAQGYYERALGLDRERPESWFQLALAREAVGDAVGALDALLEVLDLDPGHSDAVRRTVIVVDRLEDDELAAQFLERLTELIEEDGEALSYIGFKLLAQEHYDGALSAFARAADLEFGAYETLIGAAAAAYALGEEKAAKGYWVEAIATLPDEVGAWLEMARTFGPDLPARLTRQLIDGAATIVSEDAGRLCDVAEAALEIGQAAAAKVILALALKIEPENSRAQKLADGLPD